MPEPGLKIVVDENVPFARETFGPLGDVTLLHGRRIAPADVRDADALIVRSITHVGEPLLAGSGVRFVGTATIGVDHVDQPYLRSRGIAFASAPGSNANSVSEYITAALLLSARARQTTLEGSTIAIVGVGNVGTRVAAKAEALGMRTRLNDPPKQRQTGDARYVTLDRALRDADYVTMHVPLERSGPDATLRMAGAAFFTRMRDGAVFLNTSRGDVVEEPALTAAIDAGSIAHAILDVFEHEPAIDAALVRRAFLATPHIAGYSYDGKIAATMMLYAAMHEWLKRPAPPVALTLVDPPPVDLRERTEPDEDLLRDMVSSAYDITRDDRALRDALGQPDPGAAFDALRKSYPRRREFPHTSVVLPKQRAALIAKARGLGFAVETQ
jgi:erythronate-4-phosphate dehydrogenase